MPEPATLLEEARQLEQEARNESSTIRATKLQLAMGLYSRAGAPEETVRIAEANGLEQFAGNELRMLAPKRLAAGDINGALRAFGFSGDPEEGIRAITEYLARSDPKQAVDAILEFHLLWEGDVYKDQVVEKLVEELRRRGDVPSALDVYKRSNSEAMRAKGRQLAKSHAQEALDKGDLAAAVRLDGMSDGTITPKVEAMLERALNAKDYATAARAEEALGRKKEALDHWRLVANEATNEGDVVRAARAYDRALRLLDDLEARGGAPLGNVERRGLQQVAAETLEKAAGLLAEEGDLLGAAGALRRAGELHDLIGNRGQAITDFKRAGGAFIGAAEQLLKQGRHKEALDAYRSAAAAFQAQADLLAVAGSTAEQRAALAQAAEALEKAADAAEKAGLNEAADALRKKLEEIRRKQAELDKKRVSSLPLDPSTDVAGVAADTTTEVELDDLRRQRDEAWEPFFATTRTLYDGPGEEQTDRWDRYYKAKARFDELDRQIIDALTKGSGTS